MITRPGYFGYSAPIGRSLSGDGSTVIGVARTSSSAEDSAYLWTRDDGFRLLDELAADAPDAQAFWPGAISGDGSRVVGTVDDTAVVWQRGVGTTVLPFLSSGTSISRADGISDDGRFVVGSVHDGGSWSEVVQAPGGGYFVVEHPRQVPVRWDLENGTVTALSTERGVALDVSDGGVVVGELKLQIPGVVDPTGAFRWDEVNGDQFIPSGLASWPLGFNDDVGAISADGTTLVGKNLDEAPAGYWNILIERAYFWNGEPGDGEFLPADALTMIDSPVSNSSPLRIAATGVSADGSVIVGTYNGGLPATRSFVWTRAAGFQDLVVLLDALGVSTASWDLLSATDVSADGTTIVGTGWYRDEAGQRRPNDWIAVIPEPSTALLLGAGLSLLALLGSSRRPGSGSHGRSVR